MSFVIIVGAREAVDGSRIATGSLILHFEGETKSYSYSFLYSEILVTKQTSILQPF